MSLLITEKYGIRLVADRWVVHIMLLVNLLISGQLLAQKNSINYTQQLTISDGLAHNGVTSIIEDKQGFLWIGTFDGLNRYNGYEFEVYKNSVDEDLLPSNRVRAISQDKNENLWIGTDKGLAIYEYKKERFKTIYSNQLIIKGKNGPIIRQILIAKQKVFVITEKEGILLFNLDYSFVKQISPPNTNLHNLPLFNDGVVLDETHLLITTSEGLFLLDIEKDQFTPILKKEIEGGNAIIPIDKNSFLVTTTTGVAQFNYEKKGEIYQFKLQSKSLNNYRFKSIAKDNLGAIWLGTIKNGVIYIKDWDNRVEDFFSLKDKPVKVSCILPSINNGCWVGTFNTGILRFSQEGNAFKGFRFEEETKLKYGVKPDGVLDLVPLDDDRIFISTITSGFAFFNTKTEKFEPVPYELSNIKSSNSRVILNDSKNNLWVKSTLGETQQIYRINKGSNLVENIPSFKDIAPRVMTEDKKGNIWIGTVNNIFRVSINSNGEINNIASLSDHPFFQKNNLESVRTIYVDPLYNYIWIGTNGTGLFRIQLSESDALDSVRIDQYLHDKNNDKTISSNFATSIIRLPNGELWLGTEYGGVNKVIDSDNRPIFIAFTEKQGLSNNVVKNLLYDAENNLWISTNIGLNKLDTKNFQFRRFGVAEGLLFEDFLYPAAKLTNGNFVFGGLDGFSYFKPDAVPINTTLPKLAFGSLKIFNKTILPGDTLNHRVVLDDHLSDKDRLALRYDENVFSIELNALHFSNPDNYFLKYRLLPIDENWMKIPSDQRFIYYNGLQPDEYKFEVMASNTIEEWTEPKTLEILISPPWWKTTWAYLMYFLGTGLVIGTVIYYILRLQSLQHNLQIEQLEKDNVKKLNADKLRFFSNISHEIKTPLTLISGPIDLLLERFKGNSTIAHKLGLIQRQSKKILQLVNQVHDFQRADANRLEMNYSNFCLDDFVQEIVGDFKFMAVDDKKILKAIGEKEKVYVSADKDKLEKILNNLLNNAFKHTQRNDIIEVSYQRVDKNLILSVKDTGKGISEKDLPHIFERFYKAKQKESGYTGGSGIGLAFCKRLAEMHYGYIQAKSQLGEGTTIELTLPVIIEKEGLEPSEALTEALIATPPALENTFVQDKTIKLTKVAVAEEILNTRIFVAEDDLDMRNFISSVLSKYFRVTTFKNGLSCLEAMANDWPDLVISDIQMPEMDGFELCNRIKSDIKTSHIPVVLLTKQTKIDDRIIGLKKGADAYIAKPFNVEHLITRSAALLLNRRQLRERFQIDFPLTLDKSEEHSKDQAFLEKLYGLMAKNLDNQQLDINTFAKELYLNRTHFYQKVKALTNETPFELLKAYRLKKAAEILVQQQRSVNEVYTMTGFKSRTHFSKLFKEKYGITPGKYAAECMKKHS